ncbi:hypothetical protein RIF29_24388 [Crotalaria pallida]|uniref:Uncharacterized protein n=1 Tax=Crotalaria pallida TaxID=3830 RepID=A0AAN9EKG0_CROPI
MVRGRCHLHPLSRSHLPYLLHSHHYTDENRGGHRYQPLRLPWQITPLPSLNVEDRYREDNIWYFLDTQDKHPLQRRSIIEVLVEFLATLENQARS